MDAFFAMFFDAIITQNGHLLAETLLPTSPRHNREQLRRFYRSTNAANVKKDVQYQLLYNRSAKSKLVKDEGNAWVDVYVAYWNAVGEILRAEDADDYEVRTAVCSCERKVSGSCRD